MMKEVNNPVNCGKAVKNAAFLFSPMALRESPVMQVPDKRVCYWGRPSREELDSCLRVRMPAMPAVIRAKAIDGWLRRLDKKGQVGSDGFPLLDWRPHFANYANATWRGILLES